MLSELPETARGRTPSSPHVARMLDVGEPRWPGEHHAVAHDERHPYLAFHHELCISCGRCVRACDEVQGTFALTATGRGFGANVAAGLDEGFRDSACVSCGACADTCPTDAITEISLLELAEPEVTLQVSRFDRQRHHDLRLLRRRLPAGGPSRATAASPRSALRSTARRTRATPA